MKSSLSNFNLRSPSSYLVHSYLITTVKVWVSFELFGALYMYISAFCRASALLNFRQIGSCPQNCIIWPRWSWANLLSESWTYWHSGSSTKTKQKQDFRNLHDCKLPCGSAMMPWPKLFGDPQWGNFLLRSFKYQPDKVVNLWNR